MPTSRRPDPSGRGLTPVGPLLAVAVALIAMLGSGCTAKTSGSHPHKSATTGQGGASDQASRGPWPDLIMIIRHAEKPDDTTKGVDPTGDRDKRSLTATGWQRAKALIDLFDPAAPNPVRPGLARPTTVYAARPDGADSQRPSQTAQPLADHLGVHLNTDYANGDEAGLAATLARSTGAVLVCWQHGEIPTIIKKLGKQGIAATPPPPGTWPEDRFDLIWILTRTGTTWKFSQQAQQLLPGDPATP